MRYYLTDKNNLFNIRATSAIEGLSLKAEVTGVENLEVKAFSNLRKLRLLQLSHVQVKGNYSHFPRGLRWLCWSEFPEYFVPTELHLGSLVVMDLQYSNLKRLWDDQKVKVFKITLVLRFSSNSSLLRFGLSFLPFVAGTGTEKVKIP